MTFDPTTIYCLATGKPIAEIGDDELGVIMDSFSHIPVSQQAEHIERLALLSMRPSIVWMNVSPQTIESVRQSAPRQLLAYLMNRMYAPIDVNSGKLTMVSSLDSTLAARRLRVQIWDSIESAQIAQDQLDSILFVLLELDSRFNLSKLHKPTALVQLWQNWSEDNASQLIHELWEWRNKLVAEHDKALRMARASEIFWSEGNRLTRTALTQQFKKVTPPTPRQAERKAKSAKLQESVDFLDSLERELTKRPEGSPKPAMTPTPVHAPKIRLTRFGPRS